jgi:hypothetical protein
LIYPLPLQFFSAEKGIPQMPQDRRAQAQQSLDELFSEQLLPFKLSAGRVAYIGVEEYIVYFDDSRLPAVNISFCEGESFKDVVRAAVVERLVSISRPLLVKPAI